jgi:hypothetical protein
VGTALHRRRRPFRHPHHKRGRLRDRHLSIYCRDGKQPRPLALIAGALGSRGEIDRDGKMVGPAIMVPLGTASIPGAAGFLVLSQALEGPDR